MALSERGWRPLANILPAAPQLDREHSLTVWRLLNLSADETLTRFVGAVCDDVWRKMQNCDGDQKWVCFKSAYVRFKSMTFYFYCSVLKSINVPARPSKQCEVQKNEESVAKKLHWFLAQVADNTPSSWLLRKFTEGTMQLFLPEAKQRTIILLLFWMMNHTRLPHWLLF